MVLLLLSYHRRLRMISGALELRVEGVRVSHSWSICVVNHGYSGLDGDMDGYGGWHVCGTKPRALVECREMPDQFRMPGDTPMTPDHNTVLVRSSGWSRAGICRSFWKGLNMGRDVKATHHGASWTHRLGVRVICRRLFMYFGCRWNKQCCGKISVGVR